MHMKESVLLKCAHSYHDIMRIHGLGWQALAGSVKATARVMIVENVKLEKTKKRSKKWENKPGVS